MRHNNELRSPAASSSNDRYNGVVTKVSRLLDTEIQQRPVSWSPSRSTPSLDETLHRHMRYLFYQDLHALDQLVQNLESYAARVSSKERVARFVDELQTVASKSKSSLKQPVFTPGSTETRSLESRRSTRSVAPALSHGDSTPSSSGSTRSFASGSSIVGEQPETARTSFASVQDPPSTQYGSSWGPATQDELKKASQLAQAGTIEGASSCRTRAAITPPLTSASRMKRNGGKSEAAHNRPSRATDAKHVTKHNLSPPTSPRRRSDGKKRRLEDWQGQPVHHQVRDFPDAGFGLEEPKMNNSLALPLRWDILRLRDMFNLTNEDTTRLRSWDALQAKVLKLNADSVRKFELSSVPKVTMSTFTPILTASMLFNEKREGPLFTLRPNRIRLQKSCRISRFYGWRRLLFVNIDMKKGAPSHLRSQEAQLDVSFKRWLLQPVELLGRTWRAFHLQENALDKNGRSSDEGRLQWRVAFFAEEGDGLNTVLIHDFLLTWMIPARFNARQTACKAYSRIDLGLSKTTPTIRFKPEQIRLIDDLLPTAVADTDPFMDSAYQFEHRRHRPHDPQEAMTDGCACISVGAAKLVCEALGLEPSQRLPVAFQARVFGSKGVWYISAGYDTEDPAHLKPWIEIRPSQMKVLHCQEMSQLASEYRDDETLLSFDVVKYSRAPKTAELHRDFLQILEDRGVQRSAIMDLAAQSLDNETEQMVAAIRESVTYARLLQTHAKEGFSLPDVDKTDMPIGSAERLVYFLREGGFMPDAHRFMAGVYTQLCAEIKLRALQRIRIPCPESLMLLGISHPLVPPGKIHINLSEGVSDGINGYNLVNLGNKTILVARDPTLRASDIQKYECIMEPRLAHLKDVVVFSAEGSMPGAAKHQGGDYDGDMFWVCWHAPFTLPFKNAPVLECKRPDELGIVQDKTRLSDFISSDGSVTKEGGDRFLEHSFDFKYRPRFLGIVTNYLYTEFYNHPDISSATVLDGADLHDHLNDEAKNGYTFSKASWSKFLKDRKLDVEMKDPAYKISALQLTRIIRGSRTTRQSREAKKPVEALFGAWQGNKSTSSHILDVLYFEILLKRAETSIRKIIEALKHVTTTDSELTGPFSDFLLNAHDKSTLEERRQLKRITAAQIRKVMDNWSAIWSSAPSLSLQDWFKSFFDIQPPPQFAWMCTRHVPYAPTVWEIFRASILFDRHHDRAKPLFWLAKTELCYMKKHSEGGRRVLAAIEPHLRVRKPKTRLEDEMPDMLDIDVSEEDDDNDCQFGYDDLLNDLDLEGMLDR